VVARLLKAQVNFVAMFATDATTKSVVQTRSEAYYASSELGAKVTGFEKDIKIKLAGSLAQQIARRGIAGQADDLAQAKNMSLSIVMLRAGEELPPPGVKTTITINTSSLDESKIVLKTLCEETRALLTENWPAVERVAQALMARDILDQDDLDRLINGVSAPK
jgi:ATP-dependent Zn protease